MLTPVKQPTQSDNMTTAYEINEINKALNAINIRQNFQDQNADQTIDFGYDTEIGAQRRKLVAYNQRNSPLLRLPAEIRNIIYDYAIGSHEICAKVKRGIVQLRHGASKVTQALPQASYQLRYETELLVYKYSKFRVRYRNITFFIDSMSKPAMLLIETLIIELHEFTGVLKDENLACLISAGLVKMLGRGSLAHIVLVKDKSFTRNISEGKAQRVAKILEESLLGFCLDRRVTVEAVTEHHKIS
ncbi:hypothetical protein OPT61_g9717 [Boeremia exigua]|uniref:Uncharacterized protein n=1 Tax=Boeremia exigua TaxID=749465 RepID=A0ACC2HUH7_9PLEO|nr:hypothetical protein OPT61_g9717 [Boeremia exigua]